MIEVMVAAIGTILVFLAGLALGRTIYARESTEKFLQGQFMGVSSVLIDVPLPEQTELLARLTERWDDPGKRAAAAVLGATAYYHWRRENPEAFVVEGPEFMKVFKRKAEKGDVR